MSAAVTFAPWIGPEYRNGGVLGLRTLILGESHYGDENWCPDGFTTRVVKTCGIEKRHAFFTRVATLVLDASSEGRLDNARRASFWNSVAFYNYVQTWVGRRARSRPSDEMWRAASKPFQSVLADLQPRAIVVLGKELWRHVPSGDRREAFDGQHFRVFREGACVSLAGHVQHPSSPGFRYQEWQPRVNALLKVAHMDSVAERIANGP